MPFPAADCRSQYNHLNYVHVNVKYKLWQDCRRRTIFSVSPGDRLVHTPGMRPIAPPHRHATPAARAVLWLSALLAGCLCLTDTVDANPRQVGERVLWDAGPFSFSDELGGFKITGATGKGTKEEPIVITQELLSATPVTMVIRAERPIRPYRPSTGEYVTNFTHFRTVILNGSAQAWIEFEFELQELQGKASIFGDGLSFDQRRADGVNVTSDRFAEFSRDFEPYDRLLFHNGKVDPREQVSFGFMITDFTPRWEFFLVQDPRIPAS